MEIEPNLNTSQTQDLQKKLNLVTQKKQSANRVMLAGLFFMLVGAGLCSLLVDKESALIVGLIPLTLGLVLFLVGSIQISSKNSTAHLLQNKLASINPSGFKPYHRGVAGVLGTIFLVLLTLAIIGVGGCFAFFGWGSVLG